MVLGQHRRMWLEAMRQTEQRVYGFGSLKDGYALVGIHLRKQKCCLKKGTTSKNGKKQKRLPSKYLFFNMLGSLNRLPIRQFSMKHFN